MENEIFIALIVAGSTLLGTLIGVITQPLLQFLSKHQDEQIDKRKWDRDLKFKEHERKRQLYIDALWLLREIQIGFDIDGDMLFQQATITKAIDDVRAKAQNFLPELMLVSNIVIFDTFNELLKYSNFTYTGADQSKLFEESKTEFSNLRVKLSRLMQIDLGIKHDKTLFKKAKCSKCSAKLKGQSICPKCGHLNTFPLEKVIIENQQN